MIQPLDFLSNFCCKYKVTLLVFVFCVGCVQIVVAPLILDESIMFKKLVQLIYRQVKILNGKSQ